MRNAPDVLPFGYHGELDAAGKPVAKVPILWWDNHFPMAFAIRWPGRGLQYEVGGRVYHALVFENDLFYRSVA